MSHPGTDGEVISFGPFGLIASERLITKSGDPVNVSPRAFDVLLALLSKPNELMTKGELLAKVWSGINVEEGSLRFHVAGLRKALGDGKNGARYIATLPGRGYCFVAPISVSFNRLQVVEEKIVDEGFLPKRSTGMVGRDTDVLRVSALLNNWRVVSILGDAGIGKTTLAVAVGHRLLGTYAGSVLFVDLGTVDANQSPAMQIAAMVGLCVQSDDPISGVLAFLRDKRMLLILDGCEKSLDSVRHLISKITLCAPQVHVLTTSRQSVQQPNEHVYWLGALETPCSDQYRGTSRSSPAEQLLLSRATERGGELSSDDFALAEELSGKLIGLPLAIEFAGNCIGDNGAKEGADSLLRQLGDLWKRSSTAPANSAVLKAVMDWSYAALSSNEKLVLQRLSIFSGPFTLDAALAIANDPSDSVSLLGIIESLKAQSWLADDSMPPTIGYRLLDPVRAYVLTKWSIDHEGASLRRRFCAYLSYWLEQNTVQLTCRQNVRERIPYLAPLTNAQIGLKWCFGLNGDVVLGEKLAAAAAPALIAMSMPFACLKWSECALSKMPDTLRRSSREMHLLGCLGHSIEQMFGQTERGLDAVKSARDIAHERHDLFHEAVFLSVLHASYLRRGELRSAVRYGAKCSDIADQLATPEVAHLAHSVIGGLSHYSGDLRRSRTELENHLTSRGTDKHVGPVYLAYDMHVRSAIHLARTLWLQGHPSEGIALTRRTISDAKRLEAPESLVAVSLLGASVFTWAGEYEAAGDAITFSLALAECHSMGRLVTVGRARKGELDVTRGFARDGVLALRAALAESHTGGEGLFATEFNVTLIHGLTTLGCFEEALPVADENIRLAKAEAALTYLPELLRLKGKLALASRHGIGEAKKLFQESLERSRQMGALAWELRTSVDLAALIASEGDFGYARRLLEDVCARFADSFRTRDINAAVRLLDTFR